MSNRLDKEREQELQPQRIQFAVHILKEAGFDPIVKGTVVEITHKGQVVTLEAYSGWFTGKTVEDGRGIENLLKQISKKNVL